MQRLNNLPLAARLGAGFGALGLALVVVALFAGSAIGGLKGELDTMGGRDLRTLTLVSEIGSRAEAIGHLTAQHLYVHDGDAAAQKRIEARIMTLKAANGRDIEALERLIDAEQTKAALTSTADARKAFVAAYSEAVRRSTRRPPPARRSATALAPCTPARSSRRSPGCSRTSASCAAPSSPMRTSPLKASEARATGSVRTILIVTGLALVAAALDRRLDHARDHARREGPARAHGAARGQLRDRVAEGPARDGRGGPHLRGHAGPRR